MGLMKWEEKIRGRAANKERFRRPEPSEIMAFDSLPRLNRTEVLAVRWIYQLRGEPYRGWFRVGEDGEKRFTRARELRRLIRLGCIAVMGVSPARYRVTQVGRLAAGLSKLERTRDLP
jgi:hypothetical protein